MAYAWMHWSNIFFVHWRVPSEQLEPRIPPGLNLDLFDGDAYVSLVALHVTGPAPWPVHLLPFSTSYRQLNVRTYISTDSWRGIFLLETLVDRLLPAFGARFLGMPYRLEHDLYLKVYENNVSLHAPDIDIEGEISDTALQSSLVSFLTERYSVYARAPGGSIYGLHIEHEPWRLRTVNLKKAPKLSALGFSGGAEPFAAHLAEEMEVSVVGTALVRI